jgi:endonuclease IV
MTRPKRTQTHHCHGETSRSLDDLRQLIDDIGAEDGRVKICIDLCHLFVDQYDLFSPSGREEFFASLDRLGMTNVAAIHVSDSGEVHGGTKDCHMK